MKGIDISSYQQVVDFNQVKNDGVEIVILKASEGKTWQDSTFREKYNNAKAVGLKVGAYHFLRGNAVQDEVNNFLSMVGNLPMDCKYIIDAETDLGGIEANSNQVKAFYDIMTSKGYDTALYTGEYFYNSKLNESVKNIPLWVAKYSSNKPNVPSYIGWQYTDNGHVAGINSGIDMNEFNEGIFIGNVNSQNQPIQPQEESLLDKAKRYIGDKCKELQTKLIALGYDCGGYGADGDFGQGTLNSLIKFQADNGLTQDGLAGNKTMDKLDELIAKKNQPKGNDNVKALQHLCNILGIRDENGNVLIEDGINGQHTRYCVSRLPLCGIPYIQREATKYIQSRLGIGVDGIFGSQSANKIKQWQSAHGLTSDGIVGSQTWLSFLN